MVIFTLQEIMAMSVAERTRYLIYLERHMEIVRAINRAKINSHG